MRLSQIFFGMMAGAFLLAGCATSPVERRENVAHDVTDVKSGMIETRGQIDKTLASLDSLVHAPPSSLEKAYKQYASDVDTLKKQSNTLEKNASQLQKERENWLSKWQASQGDLRNEELRNVSQERRTALASRFNDLRESFQEAEGAFRSFIANLDDVKTVVGNDLTPRGIDAISRTAVVENANTNGAEVNRILDQAIEQFDSIADILAPPNAS